MKRPVIRLNTRFIEYIRYLVEHYPEISYIWLFGSRTNGRASKESDWDIMIFGNRSTAARMRCDPFTFRAKADVFIAVKNAFRSVWPSVDGTKRSGTLVGKGSWRWRRIAPRYALYDGAQRPYDDQSLPLLQSVAVCIYDRSKGYMGGEK